MQILLPVYMYREPELREAGCVKFIKGSTQDVDILDKELGAVCPDQVSE